MSRSASADYLKDVSPARAGITDAIMVFILSGGGNIGATALYNYIIGPGHLPETLPLYLLPMTAVFAACMGGFTCWFTHDVQEHSSEPLVRSRRLCITATMTIAIALTTLYWVGNSVWGSFEFELARLPQALAMVSLAMPLGYRVFCYVDRLN